MPQFKPLLFSPETEFTIDTDVDGGYILSTALAESGDSNCIVTLDCTLAQIMNAPFGTFEFAFAISESFNDDGELGFSTQDREIAKALIPGESKPYVMETVQNALRFLVMEVQPDAIYRVTKAGRLPVKAMAKHELLTETLQSMGYGIVDSGTDGFERRWWMMHR